MKPPALAPPSAPHPRKTSQKNLSGKACIKNPMHDNSYVLNFKYIKKHSMGFSGAQNLLKKKPSTPNPKSRVDLFRANCFVSCVWLHHILRLLLSPQTRYILFRIWVCVCFLCSLFFVCAYVASRCQIATKLTIFELFEDARKHRNQ